MLESCKSAQERWGGVHDLIDRWLNERQDLLVKYCSIEGLDELQNSPATVGEKVQLLCQVLVDYVSAGHFEVYEQLIKEAKEFGDENGIQMYEKLYPLIEENTQIALDFNDKYLSASLSRADRTHLSKDLSALGEALESRFLWEDQLIESLHESHREDVA